MAPWSLSNPNTSYWNVNSIDDFVERFLRGNKIRIGSWETDLCNFTKHSKYIATFDTVTPLSELDTLGVIVQMSDALSSINTFNNVYLDVIDNEQNPLMDTPTDIRSARLINTLNYDVLEP